MRLFIVPLVILATFLVLINQPPITSQAKIISPLPIETNTDTELFPVKQNGKWGYIDKLGQIIIMPKYLVALPFSEDIAFVRTSKHVKAIDSLGNSVFTFSLDNNFPGAYSEGLAPFLVDGKYGFIDKKGKTVIDFKYDFAASFSEGLALVKIGENYGFIDREGKVVVEPQFALATSFSDGLAAVRYSKTDPHPIFIDKDNHLIFYKPNYLTKSFDKQPIPTDKNLKPLNQNPTSILSDPKTNFIAKVSFDSRAFSENLVSVKINNQYGYINKEGRVVIDPQFSYADAFSSGLAQISLKGKCAFINESGTIVINTPYHYYSCSRFSGGLAKIQTDGQIGYIDKNGQFVWPLTN